MLIRSHKSKKNRQYNGQKKKRQKNRKLKIEQHKLYSG